MSHHKLLLIFCTFTTIISKIAADTATCEYIEKGIKIYKDQHNKYTCELSLGNPNDFITVTDIDGDHDGQTDDDVKFLVFGQNTKLEKLSSIFCEKFPNLEAIKIDNVEIRSIEDESLQGCPNLKLLHLNNNNIRRIPENLLSENAELIELVITSNQLNSLAQDTFEMQDSLKVLFLKNNKISRLPDKIFVALRSLEVLSLDQNNLKVLNPKWFKELNSLTYLAINSNEIADLPKNVFASLTKLKVLQLKSNKLEIIHGDSFASSTELQNISLNSNQIDAIDPQLIQNSAISVIWMDGNVCFHSRTNRRNLLNAVLRTCYNNYEPRTGPIPTTQQTSTTTTKPRPKPSKPSRPVVSVISPTLSTEPEFNEPPFKLTNSFPRGTYPWIAAIMKKSGRSYEYYCGGVLVSDKKVVTTAKCLYKYEGSGFKKMIPNDIKVMLGSHDLTASSETGRITPDILSITIHPNFNINTMKSDSDIGVIVLAEPVRPTNTVKTINLMNEGGAAESISSGTVASFGYKENKKLTSKSVPKQLSANIEDSDECILKNQAIVFASGSQTFCINEETSDPICIEDIGSGLFVRYGQQFYLRGLLSSVITNDIDKCDEKTNSIFTDVPKFTKWIQSVPDIPVPQFVPSGGPIWS